MTLLKRIGIGLYALALLFAGCMDVPVARAAPVSGFMPNMFIQGSADGTANSTFATTSFADLPNATVSVVPVRNDPTVFGDLLWISASVDLSKATATSGSCGVFVNGAVLASSVRLANQANGEEATAWSALVPNTTVGAQTVKIQCKSADTNVLTVLFGHLDVVEVDQFKAINP